MSMQRVERLMGEGRGYINEMGVDHMARVLGVIGLGEIQTDAAALFAKVQRARADFAHVRDCSREIVSQVGKAGNCFLEATRGTEGAGIDIIIATKESGEVAEETDMYVASVVRAYDALCNMVRGIVSGLESCQEARALASKQIDSLADRKAGLLERIDQSPLLG